MPGAPIRGRTAHWGDRTGALPVSILGRMIVLADGEPVGDLSWHPEGYGANAGSVAFNIGISLVPEARGRGIGTRRPSGCSPSTSSRRRRSTGSRPAPT